MPTPTKGPRLGGGPAHERLILANLATSLFEHGRITTTEAKAKRLRPLAERLISKAKRGDLHARRQVLRVIRDKSIVHELFVEIGPRYADRPGGYTRITKVGPRKGDNAPMAVIELVEGQTVAQRAVGEAEGATRRSVKESASKPKAGASTVDEVAEALAPAEARDSDEASTARADVVEPAGDADAAEAAQPEAAEPETAEPETAEPETAEPEAGQAQVHEGVEAEAAKDTPGKGSDAS